MILVTGAQGFLGRYIVEELREAGEEVIADSFDVTVAEHWASLDEAYPDEIRAVIHCAALLMIDGHPPEQYFHVNSFGTYLALEFCRKHNIPLIFTMTHSDINASPILFINENTARCFTTNSYGQNSIPFIASKVAAMEMIEAYNRSEPGFQGIILRLASMRGYGSKDTKFDSPFHQFIRKAQKGEPIELWGDLKTRRDLIYVRDVARAVRMALIASQDKDIKGLYNIGSGVGLTIEDEAKAIINVFCDGKKSPLVYLPGIPEIRKHSCIFDITKAIRELAWFPVSTYESALCDMKLLMGDK